MFNEYETKQFTIKAIELTNENINDIRLYIDAKYKLKENKDV